MTKKLDKILSDLKADITELMRSERETKQGESISEALMAEIKRRMNQGETVKDICEGAGIPAPSITRWISGTRPDIRLETADKLARYLGLSLSSE